MGRFAAIIMTTVFIVMVLSSESHIASPVFSNKLMAYDASTVMSANTENVAGKMKGSFIQWWLVKEWDDDAWRKEFKALAELGMQHIVLTPVAFLMEQNDSYRTYTVYPTEIDGFEVIRDEGGNAYPDVVERCLKNAADFGIKVFLGLNFGDDWWQNRTDGEWLRKRVEEGNTIALELWDKYRNNYPESFYGWYWTWEVDNFHFRKALDIHNSRNNLAQAFKLHLDYLEENGIRMPLMVAPYMDARLGTPKTYAGLWKYVFDNAGFSDGDIFCLQDSVCAGLVNENELRDWFLALKDAVDTVPGMIFWADMETFEIRDWTALSLDVLVRRMKMIGQIVEGYMTFSYTHYYGPNVTSEGFHRTLADFVENGILEKNAPKLDDMFTAVFDGENIRLTWDDGYDDIGIFGYLLYRDGELISVFKEGTAGSASANMELEKEYIDRNTVENRKYVYELRCFDYAGNISQKRQINIKAVLSQE